MDLRFWIWTLGLTIIKDMKRKHKKLWKATCLVYICIVLRSMKETQIFWQFYIR